jgi:hypothetical protein
MHGHGAPNDPRKLLNALREWISCSIRAVVATTAQRNKGMIQRSMHHREAGYRTHGTNILAAATELCMKYFGSLIDAIGQGLR